MQHPLHINLHEEIAAGWQSFLDAPDYQEVIHHLYNLAPDFHQHTLYEFEPDLAFLCSLKLTDDADIRIMNRDFRGKDKPTNVLSFPDGGHEELDDGTAVIYLGDLVFAYETIAAEAHDQGKNFQAHFMHLCVHGLLHLLGYDHEDDDDANEMEQLEISLLEKCGFDNPYDV